MKLINALTALLIGAAFLVHSANSTAVSEEDISQIHIKVPVSGADDAEELIDLGLQIELNIIQGGIAEGFISVRDLAGLKAAGYEFSVVEPPVESIGPRKPYYDFDDIVGLLTQYTVDYPEMVWYDTAGFSIDNKPVIRFRIRSKPDTAALQRIYFSGCCHGNEKIGSETIMLIIATLLGGYESDPTIKELVDRSDFLFHPILNVDGFTSSDQGRRTLANGKDPNRAFGWKLGGKSSDGSLPYQWPEMKIYFHPMIEAPSYFSLDYHAGTNKTLDPFFCPVTGGVMDADAYEKIQEVYPPYLGTTRTTSLWEQRYVLETRGGGIGCDGSYGKCGNISVLPECCDHYPAESKLEEISGFHMDKFFDCIEEMQKGVCGRLRDARDGSPVYGRVQVVGKGAGTVSDPRSGAFYKYIPSPSGTFEVSVFANGYKPAAKTVDASSDAFALVDFDLEYDGELPYAGITVDVVGLDNEISQPDIYSCLLANDGAGAEVDGFIIVDLGAKTPVTDQDGAEDLTIYGSGTYTVSIHYDIDKLIDDEGVKLGKGLRDESFDLSTVDIDSARWVRIDASSAATIDAIEAAPREIATGNKVQPHTSLHQDVFKVISPLSRSGAIIMQAYIPRGNYSVKVFDCKGKEVATLAQENAKTAGTRTFRWHSNRSVSNGTYIFHVKTVYGEKSVTSPVLW